MQNEQSKSEFRENASRLITIPNGCDVEPILTNKTDKFFSHMSSNVKAFRNAKRFRIVERMIIAAKSFELYNNKEKVDKQELFPTLILPKQQLSHFQLSLQPQSSVESLLCTTIYGVLSQISFVEQKKKTKMIFMILDKYKHIWDIIISCFLVVDLIFLPYRIVFQLENGWFEYFDTLVDCLLFIDVLYNIRINIIKIEDKSSIDCIEWTAKILKILLKILVSIPYQFIYWNLMHIKMLRIMYLGIMVQSLQTLLEYIFVRSARYRNQTLAVILFMRTIILFFFIAHVLANYWSLIALNEEIISWTILYANTREENWNIIPTSIDYYIESIFFAVQTFSTVGYGDFPGKTNQENLYQMLMMIIGGVLYAFLNAGMKLTIMRYRLADTIMNEENDEIRLYLMGINSDLDIVMPLNIWNQIKKHLLEDSEIKSEDIFRNNEFFSKLMPEIQLKILKSAYSKFLDLFGDCFDNISSVFLYEFLLFLDPINLQPYSEIIKKGKKAHGIYFLMDDPIFALDDQDIVGYLGVGDIIGDNLIIFDKDSDYTYISSSEHTLLTFQIEADEVLVLKCKFPLDFHQFKLNMANKYRKYGDYRILTKQYRLEMNTEIISIRRHKFKNFSRREAVLNLKINAELPTKPKSSSNSVSVSGSLSASLSRSKTLCEHLDNIFELPDDADAAANNNNNNNNSKHEDDKDNNNNEVNNYSNKNEDNNKDKMKIMEMLQANRSDSIKSTESNKSTNSNLTNKLNHKRSVSSIDKHSFRKLGDKSPKAKKEFNIEDFEIINPLTNGNIPWLKALDTHRKDSNDPSSNTNTENSREFDRKDSFASLILLRDQRNDFENDFFNDTFNMDHIKLNQDVVNAKQPYLQRSWLNNEMPRIEENINTAEENEEEKRFGKSNHSRQQTQKLENQDEEQKINDLVDNMPLSTYEKAPMISSTTYRSTSEVHSPLISQSSYRDTTIFTKKSDFSLNRKNFTMRSTTMNNITIPEDQQQEENNLTNDNIAARQREEKSKTIEGSNAEEDEEMHDKAKFFNENLLNDSNMIPSDGFRISLDKHKEIENTIEALSIKLDFLKTKYSNLKPKYLKEMKELLYYIERQKKKCVK